MSVENELKEIKIEDLEPYEKKFNLKFKVLEQKNEKEVIDHENPYFSHKLGEFIVADDTGSIILSAWNEDIKLLEEEKVFKIENGFVNLYRDSMRLVVGKHGELTPIEEDFPVNVSNNRSKENHGKKTEKRRLRF